VGFGLALLQNLNQVRRVTRSKFCFRAADRDARMRRHLGRRPHPLVKRREAGTDARVALEGLLR